MWRRLQPVNRRSALHGARREQSDAIRKLTSVLHCRRYRVCRGGSPIEGPCRPPAGSLLKAPLAHSARRRAALCAESVERAAV